MSSLIDIVDQLTSIYSELLHCSKKYLGHRHDLNYDGKKEICPVCEKCYILNSSQIIIFREIHESQCICPCIIGTNNTGECSNLNGVYICPNTKCPQNKIKENFEHLSSLIEEYISSLRYIRVYQTNEEIETDWTVPKTGVDLYHKWGFDNTNNCISIYIQKKNKLQKVVSFNDFVEWQLM
jgi:hypothetical protein